MAEHRGASAADPRSPPTPGPGMPRVPVTRLLAEAAAKSDVMWVELPEGTAYPVWFVWHDDGDTRGPGPAAYVVSGPGEQTLPPLPERVTLVLRSKDSGARLLRIGADTAELEPGTERWEEAARRLQPARLNATGDVLGRWRHVATITVLQPRGRPEEEPGRYAASSGAVAVEPAPGTTAGWRPRHLGGRRRRR